MYQVEIVQRIKYTETLVGIFNSYEEIAAFLKMLAEHFQIDEIRITDVKTEEAPDTEEVTE